MTGRMSDKRRQRHEGDCSFHLTGACDCKWGPVAWRRMSDNPGDDYFGLPAQQPMRDNPADSIRRELEALTPQTCENGVHGDWWAYTEFSHQCPWCALEAARADERERHRELLEAARDYLDNGGKGQPRGIRADLWDRLSDVVTDHEAALAQAVSDGN